MQQFTLPLEFDTAGDHAFIIAPILGPAIDQLSNWQNWPHGAAILVGQPRSGKSSMGQAFLKASGGLFQDDADLLEDEKLFHLWNRAKNERRPILMASGKPVGEWQVQLPDLRSRLAASQMISIPPPDDELVEGLVRHFFVRRGTAVTQDAIDFLLKRVERSYAFIETLADYMERVSRERQQPVNRAVARDALEQMESSKGDDD